MKKIIRIFFVAAALAGFVACDDDDDADVRGRTGDYAYIVGGTEADFQSTSCEVYHTPDLEDGSVEMAITVALTRAQDTATTITIETDDSKVSDEYEALPAGLLSYSSSITIPAEEESSTISVTIDRSKFAQLVEPQYMVVFKIVDVTGDVIISSNSNSAILYIYTETIDPAGNLISVTESETSYTLNNYTDGSAGDSISKTIEISGSEEAYKSFDITLAVDNSLVDSYNEANGTEYAALSNTSIVNLSVATMETGAVSTTATISISDEDRDANFTQTGTYLIPVVVSDAGTATISSGCGVTYILVNVHNFDSSMSFFSALYLGDYRMATWVQFSTGIGLSEGFTYVFHVFIDEVTDHSRIGDFADIDENWINMLRFGQLGDKDTRLEWFVGPNGCRKNLYTAAIPAQTWCQIALVYDPGAEEGQYKIYVEGVLQDSYTFTESDIATMANLRTPVFQAIEFNSSWGANYREGNEFHGRIWHMGVFNRALSQGWLTYAYHDFNPYILAYPQYYGLAAYWGFDEGYGCICYEGTGLYEDIDFANTIRCDDESNMVSADVSEHIQWVADRYNEFDE